MLNSTKLRRLFELIFGCCFPLFVSAVLFLVLYNNTERGYLSLALLIVLNLAILTGSKKLVASTPLADYLRVSSVCVITVASCLVFLEMAFPVFLPKDYAQIMEVTRTDGERIRLRDFHPDKIFGPKSGTVSNQIDHILNSPIAWHKPGANFVYFGYDPNTNMRYLNFHEWNPIGYYDNDYSVIKPSNVYRVVLIGDSYVESVQVPLDLTFHKLTETALNSSDSSQKEKRYEIIALGNSGYGQRDEFDVLKTQGLKYDPDLVIIALCGNDFCDDDPELKWELIMAGGTITPAVRELAHHGFVALAFMKKRMEDVFRNRVKMNPELLQWSRQDIPIVEKAWRRTLDYSRKSRDLCQAKGVKFLLLYVGSEIEVRYALDPEGTVASLKAMGGPNATMDWDILKSVQRMKTYCDRFHINFASLVGPLAEAQGRTGNVVFADHYSFFGQEIVARALTCFMKELTISGKPTSQCIDHCFK
ncbi:MAG: hypothetical protein ACP5VS_08595 [Desulfomonilaceae bacterium]